MTTTRKKPPARNPTRKKTSPPAKGTKKRKTKKKPSKFAIPWSWFTYIGLFSLMLICFVAGFWARPYIEKRTRTEKIISSKPPSPAPHISRKHIPRQEKPVPAEKHEIEKEKEAGLEVTSHGKTVQIPDKKPELKKICIILDDFGFNLTGEIRELLEVHPALNVAILPERPFSRKVMDLAASLGHEILIHAPFEGSTGSTEEQYIHKGDTAERIHALLGKWYDALPLAVGINNHQGSEATADAATMDSVMAFLKKRNLLFVDSWTARKTVGFRVAKLSGVPYGARIIPFLDNDGTAQEVRENLNRLFEKAGNSHVPIAIGHATKRATREVLMDMAPRLESMGYRLVPVSEAVRHPS